MGSVFNFFEGGFFILNYFSSVFAEIYFFSKIILQKVLW
jgi:hypothetical protein